MNHSLQEYDVSDSLTSREEGRGDGSEAARAKAARYGGGRGGGDERGGTGKGGGTAGTKAAMYGDE